MESQDPKNEKNVAPEPKKNEASELLQSKDLANLDAKLHHAYDPDSAVKDHGNMLSNIAFSSTREENSSVESNSIGFKEFRKEVSETKVISNTTETHITNGANGRSGTNSHTSGGQENISFAASETPKAGDSDESDYDELKGRPGTGEAGDAGNQNNGSAATNAAAENFSENNIPAVENAPAPDAPIGSETETRRITSPAEPHEKSGSSDGDNGTTNPNNSGNGGQSNTPNPIQPPIVTMASISGTEGQPVLLPINLVADNGAGINSWVEISNLPNGATLSAGYDEGNGVWALLPNQLSNLWLTLPDTWNGNLNFTLKAISERGTESIDSSLAVPLTISPVATAPELILHNISGNEDTAIAINIDAALVDTDGIETLSVTIDGVPIGANLNHGTNNGNGSWTLTPAELAGLTLTPPLHWSGNIGLTVTATASENGTTASTTDNFSINVLGTATVPNLSTQNANGDEATAIALNIAASLADTDGSEALTIAINNVPSGAILNHGTNNGNGSWTLTPADLNGLTITPALGYSGSFNLNIMATSSENGTVSNRSAVVGVNVAGVATAPTLNVQGVSGTENAALPLAITSALVDNDGSETLSITISGVPTGASLNHGTDNGNGTWTLTSADLTGLTITPPANYSGNFNLGITATSSENNTTANTTATLGVSVAGVAGVPTLNVTQNVNGVEDTAIPLTIASSIADTDGSEVLSITISGVPNGATLNHGTNNGNGSWTLTPADLTGLTITPALHSSGNIALTVTATSTENGTSESTTDNINIAVAGVATTPNLAAQGVSGAEDTAIALNLSASLADTDGSETLAIVVSGVPTGASLSAGINNGNGTWILTPADLTGLTVTPPLHWSGNIPLTINAISSENGTTATSTANFTVSVAGVATAPDLTVQNASGSENTTIPLNISAALVDTDGSEVLSVAIISVPAGSVLNHGTNNNDGTWTLTPAELTGLTFTPPTNWSGNLNLMVRAISSENGTTATTTSNLAVTVAGVLSAPSLILQTASGNEDNAIPVSITPAIVNSHGTETLSITVSGVPTGATLSAGTNNGNGTWTLTPLELVNLSVTPPANYSGSMILNVTATATDSGHTSNTNGNLVINVGGVADAPTLSVQAANGNEDSAIPLTINAGLTDTDGSETLTVTISNVPSGSVLNHGTDNGNGSWTLAAGDLAGLTITPPSNYKGTLNLSVVATSSENGPTASSNPTTMAVTVAGVADAPTLSVQAASGNEDSAIPLSITSAVTDNTETLSVTISGVPTGATLNKGTDNGNGSWTLTPAQLSGLTITPPSNYSGSFNLSVTSTSSENGTSASTNPATLAVSVAGVADSPTLSVQAASGNEDSAIALNINAGLTDTDGSESLSITISGVPTGASLNHGTNNGNGTWTLTPAQLSGLTITPPANYSGNFNLSVVATSSENGTSASTTPTSMSVTVGGVADAPTLSVQAASGSEDSPIPLNINAGLTDTDGSETLSVTISNIPSGSVLNHGTNNGNGSWTIAAADLSGLTLTPPTNYKGTLNLSVVATSSENGTTASTSPTSMAVTVAGVADAPTLSVQAANGNEDSAISLSITSAVTDSTETLSVTISGVPNGASLNHGTNNGNGTWTLTSAQLSGLTITPPSNYSGSFNLTVNATSSENGTSASASPATLAVNVGGTADTPTLSVQTANGNEGAAIPLSITAGLTDNDGSESLSVTISNVPTGAVLNKGTDNGNGTWTLTPAQLSGLTITPPANYSGTLNLSVIATSSENGTSASTAPTAMAVNVSGVATTPTLSVQAASGNEDSAIPLSITSALVDTDSETLSITITGVPNGASLNHGTNNGNGSWTLTPAQLSGLTITPPANYSGSFNLSVVATSSENATTASTNPATLGVTVAGVVDTPTLSVQAASGNEDSAIALNINAALVDIDGSETLSVTISNVPTGAILNHGTNNGNGTWTLTPAQLSGLTITPASNYSGSFNLSVTATSSENGVSASTTPTTMAVTVAGVADTPTLSVQAANGSEDSAIPLSITAGLTDTDGSETLSVTISNVPSGSVLNHGTDNGNGTWTLTPAQLSGLTITPPSNYKGTMNLSVVATSSENGTSASTTPTAMAVSVAGVADAPTLSVQAASGNEDSAIPLSITSALTDSAETLSITIAGVPSGASLNHGTNNGNGSWTLTPAQLSGLTITPASNYSGSFNLTVTATSSENGTSASATPATLAVTVAGVADTPTLSVQAASGNEDAAIPLTITSALTDTDGSENLSINISGVPTGAILNHGTNNGNGSWTLTPAQLSGLTITPASNYSGSFNLSVTATSSENGTTATTSTSTLGVTVAGVADTPTLSVTAASGNEDSAIPLSITSALSDTDGSESLSITITGVPTGASLNKGTNNGGGSWTLTAAQLSGLSITPPANYSGSFNLSVTATSSENGTTATTSTATLGVTVAGVADTPTLSVQAASGNEDAAIPLTITSALADTDGSETLSINISGVPTGASLNKGTNNGNGSWTLTAAQLSGLTITPPANYSGSFNLTVTSTSSENSTTASINTTLGVTVAGVADAPSLVVQTASGNEDSAIALNITSALADTDGSETLSIQISGVPTGATLNKGTNNGGGVWTLTSAQLSGLTITPPANSNSDFNLTVKATASENSTTAFTQTTLPVVIKGVADVPTLTVQNASGNEDAAIPLTITSALADTDGSEAHSIVISGMPAVQYFQPELLPEMAHGRLLQHSFQGLV